MAKGHPYEWIGRYPQKVEKRGGGNYLYGLAENRYNGSTHVIVKDSHDVVVSVSNQDVWDVAENQGYVDEEGKLTKKAYVRAGITAVDIATTGTTAIVSLLGEAALATLFGTLFEMAVA